MRRLDIVWLALIILAAGICAGVVLGKYAAARDAVEAGHAEWRIEGAWGRTEFHWLTPCAPPRKG